MKILKRKIASQYKSAHTSGRRHLRRRPYIIPLSGLVLGFCIVMAALIGHGGSQLRPSDAHVVFLFDSGQRRVLDTRAKTIGELLGNLPLHLIPQDVIEPARDTPIVEDNFRVNIYRARPVTVIDNGNRTVTLTAQKSPRVVAQNAGLTVYPEDNAAFEVGTLKENVIGEKVVVDRATPVLFNLYGTSLDVHTRSKTVADLLKEKHVVPAAGDSVQPAMATPISPNLQVFVIRNGTQVATVEEAIPAPVQIIQDSSLSFGATAVRQAGSPGKKLITYQIQTQNGQETSRSVIQQAIITAAVPQIIARGSTVAINGDKTSLMAAAGISSDDYAYVNYIISRESNWNPGARNGSGCLGLGQACPGSKLTSVCSLSDAVCQLQFFSGYANRYGGWGGAYNYWQGHRYW